MQIEFERSGGFAGISIHTTVDTDTLPPEEAREWKQLVHDTDFFNVPASINGGGSGADQFHYVLTVKDKGLSRTIEASDTTLPDELRPLVDRLMTMARSARRA